MLNIYWTKVVRLRCLHIRFVFIIIIIIIITIIIIIDLELVSVDKKAKENLAIIPHGLINNVWYHKEFAFYVVLRL